jgi:hypothetical protein
MYPNMRIPFDDLCLTARTVARDEDTRLNDSSNFELSHRPLFPTFAWRIKGKD